MLFNLLLATAFADEPTTENTSEKIVFIDFEEVELEGELVKPSITFIQPSRQPAEPDLLIIDVRQLFIDRQSQQNR